MKSLPLVEASERVRLSRLHYAVRTLAVVAVLAFAACNTIPQGPRNLSALKSEIRVYVESGGYRRDLESVAAQAKSWLEERAARGGKKLTVVFDLDETLLSNWPEISAMDFGYVPPEWDRWVAEAKAPPIESVREVYRTARRLGVDVAFITGRPESLRGDTERNLQAIECGAYAVLVCKPKGLGGTTAAFKTAAREKLTREGRTIIANLGDQESDLAGGFAERTFKLPNVFYTIE